MSKMKGTITSYEELLMEKQRLKLVLQQREQVLKNEVDEIYLRFKPMVKIIQEVEKFATLDKSNPAVNTMMGAGIDLILRKVVLRNAGWMARLLVPILLKNYVSHNQEVKTSIWKKITNLFGFGKA